ncbi:MAG: hypothetical protein LBP79_04430 [Clostridiales bacterium]|jgi:hypothetical protein|nr:hypothetical protein [Clostridiales bacterium]
MEWLTEWIAETGYVGTAYAVAFIAIAAGALFSGFTKGWKRSLLRLVLTVVAVLLTVAALPAVLDLVLTSDFSSVYQLEIEGTGVSTLQEIVDVYIVKYAGEYISADSGTAGLAVSLAKMLVSLVVFFVLFGIINFFMQIVYWLIKGLVDSKHTAGKKFKSKKLVGALIGAVNGAVLAFVSLAPVLGLADLAQPFVKNEFVRGKLPEEILVYADEFVDYDGFVKKILGYDGLDVDFLNRITRVENSDGTELSASDFKEFSEILTEAVWLYENKDKLQDVEAMSEEEMTTAITYAQKIVDFLFENGVTEIILNDGLKYLKDHPITKLDALKGLDAVWKELITVAADALFGDYGATEKVRAELNALFGLANNLIPQIKWFAANSAALSGIFDGTLTDETVKEAFTEHAQAAIDALFGAENDTLITKVAAEIIVGGTDLSDMIPEDFRPAVAEILGVIGAGGSENVKANLRELLSFAVDLVGKTSVVGTLKSVDGATDGGASALRALLADEDFVEIFRTNIGNEAVSGTIAGLVDALLKDTPQAGAPLGDFFRELGKNPSAVAVEFGFMSNAFGAIESFDWSELSKFADGLNAVFEIEDGGAASLTQRTIAAIIANVFVSEILRPDAYEAVGIITMPSVAGQDAPAWSGGTWTGEAWTAEINIVNELLTALGEAVSSGSEIDGADLTALGGALDNLKESKLFYNDYNGFVGFVLGEANDALGGLLDGFDGDYRTVEWKNTFAVAYAAYQLSRADLSGVIDAIAETVEDIIANGIDGVDGGDLAAVYEAVANSVGGEVIAVIQEILSGIISDGGAGEAVSGVLENIPNDLKEKLAEKAAELLTGGESAAGDAAWITDFLAGLFDYISEYDPA